MYSEIWTTTVWKFKEDFQIEKEIDKDICVFIPLTKEGVIKELRGIESDHADDLSLY